MLARPVFPQDYIEVIRISRRSNKYPALYVRIILQGIFWTIMLALFYFTNVLVLETKKANIADFLC